MNRFAAFVIVGLCISLSGCPRTGVPTPAPPPPPAPTPAPPPAAGQACALPTPCLAYSGKIPVPTSGVVAAAQQCLVVDPKIVSLVEWEGGPGVQKLAIEWLGTSPEGYYCDKPPTPPADCKLKNCTFDPKQIPAGKDEFYCLCYRTVPTATDGTTALADPRLIIRR